MPGEIVFVRTKTHLEVLICYSEEGVGLAYGHLLNFIAYLMSLFFIKVLPEPVFK
jgi:hypothetical protein